MYCYQQPCMCVLVPLRGSVHCPTVHRDKGAVARSEAAHQQQHTAGPPHERKPSSGINMKIGLHDPITHTQP